MIHRHDGLDQKGFTIAELTVSAVVLITFTLALLGVYTVMVGSANNARIRSIAISVATAQLEYLRSLPYDDLAIEGGTINSSGTKLPANKTVVNSNYSFIVTSDIQYVDDAYDGCLTYPASSSYLCRNGPPKAGSPVDSNPRDYKLAEVAVKEKGSNKEMARVSTQIAARVAETGGSTGALLVTITDSSGQPVSGATVQVVNTTLSPNFNQSDTSDTNGVALFLDVTPDSGKDFIITASKSGYSSLSTIAASGSLSPTYPNVSVLAQQVTNSTLKIDQLATDSLQINLVDANGTALPNGVFSIKGGIKLYTSTTDQTYSFSQNAVTADATGQYTFHNLVPGPYYVCFNLDLCSSGNYLTITQGAYGNNSLQPLVVNPGTTSASGSGPMQLGKLFISSSSSYPRVKTIAPTIVSSASSGIATTQLTITGANLNNATVSLRQGATVKTTSKVGTDSATSIKRQVNLTSSLGAWEVLVVNGGTATQNGLPPGTLGGINVTP